MKNFLFLKIFDCHMRSLWRHVDPLTKGLVVLQCPSATACLRATVIAAPDSSMLRSMHLRCAAQTAPSSEALKAGNNPIGQVSELQHFCIHFALAWLLRGAFRTYVITFAISH